MVTDFDRGHYSEAHKNEDAEASLSVFEETAVLEEALVF
jgi:hypothetical protein